MKALNRTWICTSLALCLIASSLRPAAAADLDETIPFDIPANTPLGDALIQWSNTAHLQVMFATHNLDGKVSAGAKGSFTPRKALAALLQHSGLVFSVEGNHTVTVVPSSGIHRTSMLNEDFTGIASSPVSASNVPDTQSTSNNASPTDNSAPSTKRPDFDEVLVTGSRLAPQDDIGVQIPTIYSHEEIEQSGQTNLADFLNTLPQVSVGSSSFGFRTLAGAGTVQLHGLPIGTTLILINGRRIESTSGQAGFGYNIFDLNTIPPAAIERVEILDSGASAAYGSDAIAGVVNIILRKHIPEPEITTKYSWASGIHDQTTEAAAGHEWERGGLSIIGTYENQTELRGADREITSTGNFTPYGGVDNRYDYACNPGNIYSADGVTPLPGLGSATYAAVPAGFHGTPTVGEFAATAGKLNTCSFLPYLTLIPASTRAGVFATGNLKVTDTTELFSELMFSHINTTTAIDPPNIPSYDQFTAGTSNPYNPFGVPVAVGTLALGLGRSETDVTTDFARLLVGLRGHLLTSWEWETAIWRTQDSSTVRFDDQLDPAAIQNALNSPDPQQALDPFVSGAIGSSSLLNSLLGPDLLVYSHGRKTAWDAQLRGKLFSLPTGSIDGVFGTELDRDELDINSVNFPTAPPDTRSRYNRNTAAVFGELRAPLLPPGNGVDNPLVLGVAGRYDHDSTFGGKTTPQIGLEWRPARDIAFHGGYSRAFKAPTLLEVYGATTSTPAFVLDPQKGNAEVPVTDFSGGNSHLQPETGHSSTAGIVFTPSILPEFKLSLTHWSITEDRSIQTLPEQTVLDNGSLFPGRITRDADGNLVSIDTSYLNFGQIQVRGIDISSDWQYRTSIGDFKPELALTQTYHYTAAIVPGAPATSRAGVANDDLNFSPRTKGIASITFLRGGVSFRTAVRYVGSYRDFDSLPDGSFLTLGRLWFVDSALRLQFQQQHTEFVELGATNLFNRLPQYSNNAFQTGFDGTQADIRGRYAHAQIGFSW
jgi:iron complex outermembrane recepter protein